MHIPPLVGIVREKMENIFFNVFLNFMVLRNGKAEVKVFETNICKSFWNKYLMFLSKHFVENGEGKFFPNDYSFTSNLKNVKTNTIMTI